MNAMGIEFATFWVLFCFGLFKSMPCKAWTMCFDWKWSMHQEFWHVLLNAYSGFIRTYISSGLIPYWVPSIISSIASPCLVRIWIVRISISVLFFKNSYQPCIVRELFLSLYASIEPCMRLILLFWILWAHYTMTQPL